MRWYKADLHVHSVLSPCGGLEMGPHAVMLEAKKKNIDILAITDHNSAGNLSVYSNIADKYNIKFIPGIEVQTSEEIHAIVLFNDLSDAEKFSKQLYKTLDPLENDPEYFGDQVLVDEAENISGYESRALINSSDWSFNDLILKTEQTNGFIFPAHVDAESYSIIGQLGFIPDDDRIIALGITAKCNIDELYSKFPKLTKYTLIRNSDAHYLKDIGSGFSEFFLEEPKLNEIILACKKVENRKIKIYKWRDNVK